MPERPRRARRRAVARSGVVVHARRLRWQSGVSDSARRSSIERRAARPRMQAGLGGPDGDVEDVGRLCERQAEVEVQHDDRALVDGQAARARRSRRSRSARAVGASGAPPAPGRASRAARRRCGAVLTAGRRVAGPHGEAMEPGIPRVGVAERAQSRQAETSASWTASWARSPSRRMRVAMAYWRDATLSPGWRTPRSRPRSPVPRALAACHHP